MKFAKLAMILGITSATLVTTGNVIAQEWPAKPIRVIVPTSPGGLNDLTTRAITPKLQEALG